MADFEEIYSAYFKDVYRYVLCLSKNESVAEEITQETFFKALKSINGFKGDCKISVWLCQIAKNTYFSYLKKQQYVSDGVDGAATVLADDFEQRIIADESAREIYKLIYDLDEPYKEVFMLRFFGGLSFRRISELFGKTESWARVTYHRARAKLREALL